MTKGQYPIHLPVNFLSIQNIRLSNVWPVKWVGAETDTLILQPCNPQWHLKRCSVWKCWSPPQRKWCRNTLVAKEYFFMTSYITTLISESQDPWGCCMSFPSDGWSLFGQPTIGWGCPAQLACAYALGFQMLQEKILHLSRSHTEADPTAEMCEENMIQLKVGTFKNLLTQIAEG